MTAAKSHKGIQLDDRCLAVCNSSSQCRFFLISHQNYVTKSLILLLRGFLKEGQAKPQKTVEIV